MKCRLRGKATWFLASSLLCSAGLMAEHNESSFPPGLAKKIDESDRLVIWDVIWVRGKPTGMREHKLDEVSVALADGAVKLIERDGTWSIEQQRIGSVRFVPKGTIEDEEGVSAEPSREIVFQLKDTSPPKWPTTEGIPGQFPRPRTTMLFETDRLIVWDQTWKTGERIPLHYHYTPAAAVFLEGGTLRTISEQGVPEGLLRRKAGEVINTKVPLKAPHAEEAVDGSPRAIWIQFKE